MVFVDRSLGRIQVPALLRQAGVELVTLAEHYGIPADETIEDVTWLADSAQRGWVALKDERIRRRPSERLAVEANKARCFCITNMNLPSSQMAERYLDNLEAITRACVEPGPFMYAVHANRIERLVHGRDQAPPLPGGLPGHDPEVGTGVAGPAPAPRVLAADRRRADDLRPRSRCGTDRPTPRR